MRTGSLVIIRGVKYYTAAVQTTKMEEVSCSSQQALVKMHLLEQVERESTEAQSGIISWKMAKVLSALSVACLILTQRTLQI